MAPQVTRITRSILSGNNDGNICKVKCNVGYLPGGTKLVKCVLGTWKDAKIKCVPIDCGKPKIKRAIIGEIAYTYSFFLLVVWIFDI